MSCERWEPFYSAFLDGELPAADREAFGEHLTTCSACREELESLHSLSQVLSVGPDLPEADLGFIARFRVRREKEFGSAGPRLFWRWLAIRLVPLAAAAILVAIAAVWVSESEEALTELEARELGNGFFVASEEAALQDPVLSIAFEPFPGTEP
jgi:anti-sigma factor RsiW